MTSNLGINGPHPEKQRSRRKRMKLILGIGVPLLAAAAFGLFLNWQDAVREREAMQAGQEAGDEVWRRFEEKNRETAARKVQWVKEFGEEKANQLERKYEEISRQGAKDQLEQDQLEELRKIRQALEK